MKKGESMTDYKPGTVAKATVRGVPDVTVFKLGGDEWALDRDIEGPLFPDIAEGEDVTDVRPLLVFGWVDPKGVAQRLRDGDRLTASDIADQIEAQNKPPRIPEPGPWGVVEATSKNDDQPSFYVRTAKASGADWADVGNGGIHAWDDLIDPVLIREGV